MKLKVIIVTGTPATGKTFLAKKLAKKLKYKYLDVNKIVNKISEGYDKEKKCEIVDTKKLNKELIKIIKKNKNLIIDSHLSHYLPKKYVDLCIVMKCDLKTLKKRLSKRKYSKEKLRENLDSEIFEVILEEAKKHKHIIVENADKFLSSKSSLSS